MRVAVCLGLTMMAAVQSVAASSNNMLKTMAADIGLRGPVKECVEETSYPAHGSFPGHTFTTSRLYSPEGKLLELRSGQGSDVAVTTYRYDDEGKLVSLGGHGAALPDYEYDEQGRRRSVQQLPTIDRSDRIAVSSDLAWEDSELRFQIPSGGAIVTLYDDQGRPSEAEIKNSAGIVMGRIRRTYDDKGRIVGDKLRAENLETAASEIGVELDSRLNDAQKKTMTEFMALAFAYGDSEYKYDDAGHVVQKHVSLGIWGETVSKLRYNEHGDTSEEETTQKDGTGMSSGYAMDEQGKLIPQGEKVEPRERTTKARYTYEYDSYGNWTKQVRSRLDAGEYSVEATKQRKLTYY